MQDEETGGVGSALAAYDQRVDLVDQAIVFRAPAGTIWTELHLTIDGSPVTNLRMAPYGSELRVAPLSFRGGDRLSYRFTYFVDGAASDTEWFDYRVPDAFRPTALATSVQPGEEGYEIRLASSAPLSWVDVHYAINGGASSNVRAVIRDGVVTVPVALGRSDILTYGFTYSAGPWVLETETRCFNPTAGERCFVVDQAVDSLDEKCVASGRSNGHCNLRAAIAAAASGSDPGAVLLASDSTIGVPEIEVAGSARLLIRGRAGASAITGSGGRFLSVAASATLDLEDATIRGFGAYAEGAALLNRGAVETRNVTFVNNTSSCSGTGALTSFVSCFGGAVANYGSLTLHSGTRFENNSVTATSSTASFTGASTGGGAIASYGRLEVDGPVLFAGNTTSAAATSGYHGFPGGGASASAGGGAIFNSGGTLILSPAARGCTFTGNAARASASTPRGTASSTSRGGAIQSVAGAVQIDPGACTFVGNTADADPDVGIVP